MAFSTLAFLSLIAAGIALRRAWCDRRSYQQNLEDLHRLVSEAEKSLRQRGELANEIAHEIKNPITAILCSAETLELILGKGLAEEHRKTLRYIKEYGDQLLRLVSDFIDLSRSESGKIEPQPESIKILPCVQSIVGLLESSAIRKKLKVEVFATMEDLRATIDPKHLKQIVFNLVHNAIKFTPLGGQVKIIISNTFPKPFAKIEVQDTGCGIPAAEVEDLFNPYQRGRDTIDTGTGLGLALTRTLVELAGGEIRVESKVGVGSSFQISIPRAQEHPRAVSAALELKSVGRPLEGQRFLVVDRDEGASAGVAGLLRAWGGAVDQVDLATKAVRALTEEKYDAILVDQTRDGLGPIQLSRLLRGEMKDSSTTIVVASSTPLDQAELTQSKADCAIEKPLNGNTILTTLGKAGRLPVTH
ncbi:MAG: hybrid sensor histidine kinase/response regulator [Oligoflexia bacterium]|nr:hybrid sensor histidine kinase/response regulator [Oligoflexia bacterium]